MGCFELGCLAGIEVGLGLRLDHRMQGVPEGGHKGEAYVVSVKGRARLARQGPRDLLPHGSGQLVPLNPLGLSGIVGPDY